MYNNYIRCPNCGAMNPPGTLYCVQCGTPLTSKVCPQCGTQIPAYMERCPNCGYVFPRQTLASIRRTIPKKAMQYIQQTYVPSGGFIENLKLFYNLIFKPRGPIFNVSPQVYSHLPLSTIQEKGKYLTYAAVMLLIAVGFVSSIVLSQVPQVDILSTLLFALIPALVYLYIIYSHDRYEPEPIWLIFLAFAWGAVSTFFAAILNDTIINFLMGGFAGGAAFTEEPLKLLGVFFLATSPKLRDEFNDHVDGFIYGAMAGLGFGFAENILYIGRGFAGAGMFIVLVRSITILMHMFTTGLAGWWLGYMKMMGYNLKSINAIVGMVYGMAIHFIWNTLAYLGIVALLVFIIVGPAMLLKSLDILKKGLIDEYYWGFAHGYAPRERY